MVSGAAVPFFNYHSLTFLWLELHLKLSWDSEMFASQMSGFVPVLAEKTWTPFFFSFLSLV